MSARTAFNRYMDKHSNIYNNPYANALFWIYQYWTGRPHPWLYKWRRVDNTQFRRLKPNGDWEYRGETPDEQEERDLDQIERMLP
jgi:hypothetical protein